MMKQRLLYNTVALATAFIAVFLPASSQNQVFTSSGTFTVPPGVTSIIVECWGAGGAGGGNTANWSYGGGGGAGGAYAMKTLTVIPGTNYTVTVGGATAGSTGAGSQGNPSWFGTTGTVYAEGGAGGAAPNGATATGGVGSASGSIGDVVFAGGNGADGTSSISGGGGGGAGSTGSGGNASGITAGTGTTLYGGNGGAGRNSEGDGNNGSSYGGGGGGAFVPDWTDHSGGSGAPGLVIVSWSGTFTGSGTFTVPAGVTSLIVECWGAGGAGGGTTANWQYGGGGGAGGAYAKKLVSVVPGNTYTVTVGGTTAGSTGAGSQGSPSWFGTTGTVYAEGGAGGAAPNGGTAAGGVGSAASSIGDVVYAGGNGANGNSALSGGGGGGAGSTGSGGAASGTTAGTGTVVYGGDGGAGRSNEGDGNNGSSYGGGGGGAFVPDWTDHSGGDGSAGLVIISLSPHIITHPSDFSGCNASFSIVVTGQPTLTYQWQEDNGTGFTNISDVGIYSGTTTNTLSITGASESMSGYLYRCVVTDGLSQTATSNDAMLTVSLPSVSLGYNYSLDLTLDQASGSADLTDFPALISFTVSELRTVANGGHVTNTNGYDIIFTDQNGIKLDHQIESYNAVTGQYVSWVRIPVLSHSTTTGIKMLYGDPTVSANPSVESVWTSNYKGIWHLNGTDYSDATIYSNDGTENATSNVAGKIAGGRGFNGTNSYIGVTTSGFVPNDNNQTISIWANYSATPAGNRNLVSFQNGASSSAIQLGFRGGDAVAWKWGGAILANAGSAPSINTWHYYVYTYDGTTSRIYIDGVEMNNSTVAPQTAMPSEGNIGRYNDGEYIAANLDEPRFSISPKSAGWILTEYNNQNDPSGFISLGAETATTDLTSLGVCSTTFTLDQGYPSGGIYSGTGVTGTNFDASAAGVGTHLITYSYTDITGCSNFESKNIIVTDISSAPSASDRECCVLNIVDLEASGINIQWYSDVGLTTLVGTGTPFATGETTPGVYTYYATQTVNGCESPATSVSLTIYSDYTIDTQPQPSSICEGEDAYFSVAVSGYNITYQWQEEGVNISDGGIYSGTTTSTLTLTNPGIAKSGLNYRCVVSSTCGTSPVNSNSALLTVTVLPVATFSYDGSPYCRNSANAFPTFSGGGVAGTFSSTAGLVFANTATGEIDIASSTPGTYIVTNTIPAAGGCGDVIDTDPVTISAELIWTGTVDTDWNTPGNWSCGYLPDNISLVQIPDVTNKPVINTGAAGAVKDLSIDAGSSLTISGNTIQISGSVTNLGTLDATAGTVELNGSSAQLLGPGVFSGNTVQDLVVNNPAGVTLTGPLNITGSLLATNGTLSSGGNLTLISSASATALIDGSGTGTVSGNVTMQRYLASGFGYKYISSAFQASTVSEFADDITLDYYTFYRYDESRTSSGWVYYHSPTTNPLNSLEGYAVNFGSASTPNTFDVTGSVNDGSLSVTLYNNNNTYTQGFNLVGNPYPSPIDWDAASGWTKTNIDDALYYFKASTTDQYGGTYSTYINGISSDGLATGIIPSMQGFFVHVSDGAYPVTGTLGTDNDVRVVDLTHGFLKSAGTKSVQLIRLTAEFSDDPASVDPVVIYIDDKATDGMDIRQDALKLMNTDLGVPNIYSVAGGKRLSINALPPMSGSSLQVPLGIKANRSGTLKIKLKDIDDTFTLMGVSLFDNVTGVDQNLLDGEEYSVPLVQNEYLDRFYLNIGSVATGMQDNGPENPLFNIYCSNGVIKAEIGSLRNDRGILTIYNLLGQTVYVQNFNGSGTFEIGANIGNGIYIVRLVSGNRFISRKIIINCR